MSYRLFVRDFAPETDISDLEVLFSEVGTIRNATLTDREYKGVVRKVAYIEVSSPEELSDCIVRFHGMKTDGYTLTVTEDKVHVPNPNLVFKENVKISRRSRREAASE